MDKEIEIAKKTIAEEIEKAGFRVEKIILFGSRVKENCKEDSDWDFLVIIDNSPSFSDIKRIVGNIQLKLAVKKIPNDVIIRGKKEFGEKKKIVGNISYFANKEGVSV